MGFSIFGIMTTDIDKKRLLMSLLFPLAFLSAIWGVKGIEYATGVSFSHFGLYPLRAKGLIGIVTYPLLHGDWKHLVNNSAPMLVLGWAIFYFYKEVAYRVFFLTWFFSGFWLWFFARDSYHIGASGLIYGFGAFLFLSGIIRRNRHLLAIALLVTFLYGGMVWGIFPTEERISWEGHLLGMIAGIVLAIYFKDSGPESTKQTIVEEDTEVLDEAMINYYEHEQKKKDDNSVDETSDT